MPPADPQPLLILNGSVFIGIEDIKSPSSVLISSIDWSVLGLFLSPCNHLSSITDGGGGALT